MSAPVPKRNIGGAVSRYSAMLKRANTQMRYVPDAVKSKAKSWPAVPRL